METPCRLPSEPTPRGRSGRHRDDAVHRRGVSDRQARPVRPRRATRAAARQHVPDVAVFSRSGHGDDHGVGRHARRQLLALRAGPWRPGPTCGCPGWARLGLPGVQRRFQGGAVGEVLRLQLGLLLPAASRGRKHTLAGVEVRRDLLRHPQRVSMVSVRNAATRTTAIAQKVAISVRTTRRGGRRGAPGVTTPPPGARTRPSSRYRPAH